MRKFFALTRTLLKRYGKNGMLFFVLQGVTVGMQLFILPLLTRIFTQSDFGILQFSQALINWFALFTVGNSTLGAKKGIVEGKGGTILYSFWYRMKFVVLLFLLCITFAGILFVLGKSNIAWVFLVVGIFLLIGYLPQVSFPQLYLAKNHVGSFVFWQSATVIFSQVMTIVVALLTRNMIFTLVAQYASLALLCLFAFVHGLKKYNMVEAYRKGENDTSCVPYGKKLIWMDVVQGTAGTLHNFIIGPILGFANLAVFSIATRIDTVFRALVSSGYYLLYSDLVKTDHDDVKRHFRQKIAFLLFYSFCFSVLLFVASSWYIENFLPASYHGAIVFTGILIAGIPAVIIQSIIQAVFESQLNAQSQRRAVYISQISRVLCLLIGGVFGLLGISIAMTVSSWFTMICFLVIFFRHK